MLSNIGPGMFLIILIVALLIFGPTKLPELGRAFGKTLREFKNGAKDMMDDEQPARKEVNPEVAASEQPQPVQEVKKSDNPNRLPD